MKFLSSGYYNCKTQCPARPGNKAAMNNELDNAYASFGGKFVYFFRRTFFLRFPFFSSIIFLKVFKFSSLE